MEREDCTSFDKEYKQIVLVVGQSFIFNSKSILNSFFKSVSKTIFTIDRIYYTLYSCTMKRSDSFRKRKEYSI